MYSSRVGDNGEERGGTGDSDCKPSGFRITLLAHTIVCFRGLHSTGGSHILFESIYQSALFSKESI